jgi:hypothetical protein
MIEAEKISETFTFARIDMAYRPNKCYRFYSTWHTVNLQAWTI